MSVKLLTEHHLEFLSLKGSYRCLSESPLVKMSNCWKSHAAAHLSLDNIELLKSIHCVLHLTRDPFYLRHLSVLNRESYMSAHVVFNLLNELGKRDKRRGLPSFFSLFRNEFNKFNNTRARMLDSIYHMTLRLF